MPQEFSYCQPQLPPGVASYPVYIYSQSRESSILPGVPVDIQVVAEPKPTGFISLYRTQQHCLPANEPLRYNRQGNCHTLEILVDQYTYVQKSALHYPSAGALRASVSDGMFFGVEFDQLWSPLDTVFYSQLLLMRMAVLEPLPSEDPTHFFSRVVDHLLGSDSDIQVKTVSIGQSMSNVLPRKRRWSESGVVISQSVKDLKSNYDPTDCL